MEQYRYIIWLSITWVPLIILWCIYRRTLKLYLKTGIYLNLLSFIPGVLWDYLAMKQGVWYFIEPFTTRLIWHFFPLEEFILIFSVPWFCLTATVLFAKLFKENI